MDDFVWEDEAVAVEEKEYYTKAEINEMFCQFGVQINEEIKTKIRALYNSVYYQQEKIKDLEATISELEEVVNKYLLPEKEERKKRAIERLNSGFYDTDDEEEEQDEA